MSDSDLYLEIRDEYLRDPPKDKYQHISGDRAWSFRMIMRASRIWQEHEGEVYWYKHDSLRRDLTAARPKLSREELKEFLLVKLRARDA